MNKFVYYTFLNIPIKLPLIGFAGLVVLMSWVNEADKRTKAELESTKEVSFMCINRPESTSEKDANGNVKYTCKAK